MLAAVAGDRHGADPARSGSPLGAYSVGWLLGRIVRMGSGPGSDEAIRAFKNTILGDLGGNRGGTGLARHMSTGRGSRGPGRRLFLTTGADV
jgi:hypothetical protein